jgi:hypothetical protein
VGAYGAPQAVSREIGRDEFLKLVETASEYRSTVALARLLGFKVAPGGGVYFVHQEGETAVVELLGGATSSFLVLMQRGTRRRAYIATPAGLDLWHFRNQRVSIFLDAAQPERSFFDADGDRIQVDEALSREQLAVVEDLLDGYPCGSTGELADVIESCGFAVGSLLICLVGYLSPHPYTRDIVKFLSICGHQKCVSALCKLDLRRCFED